MNNFSSVLVKPVITEKSTNAGSDNFYTFIVSKTANKHTIKQALKKYYDVDVISINTLIMKGKVKRFGKSMGSRSDYKKALIKLPEGQTLPVWGAEE
ncbi:MAG: 50S ribosomal protein L23 [Legionellales bacterium]|jgi:large subunit ribosomal protein L23|nr:50S ribosomal protein L23 [Legionellales bacterium]OUX64311.1 MAG: 50S ribosomal protein L23 [Gammaproteobacteria bacterium TMED281]|tara:strand:- start:701 stop:991 length:291 start_codon:yes stop_codon:yes gene_type:complete